MIQNLVDATIAELQHALATGSTTSVELVAKYLQRIATYDCRGPCLNSIPILNPDVFDEAAASDARRAGGRLHSPLDGIPYTLKDSMKYKGMTCATGSPAFADLVANEDAFVAAQLRQAGAVCLGRTNTPPMMASGMHRGVHGRAESPYNLDYLAAAFSSGSSNGSGASTAASFAAFGLGSETVSSGRSPASNNALVAYTPSRTVISPRGTWPLYPTCDVLVPHKRTVADMLAILDYLTAVDARIDGDFWREQTHVSVPHVERPTSFLTLQSDARGRLAGKKIAAPKMYIGGHDPKAKPGVVSKGVIELWQRAKRDLESLGATVVESDFPLVTNYEDDSVSGQANNVVGIPPDWNAKERGELVAYLWDDFLKDNRDPRYPGLGSVDGSSIFPRPANYIPDRYMEHKNFMNYPRLVELARSRHGRRLRDLEGLAAALPALEAQRHRDLEAWMAAHGYDGVVFPAAGDVGRADVDTNDASAQHALRPGVKYSHGGRAIRHLGVPTVSVPMGLLPPPVRMPVNLTFAGRHGQDAELLRWAYDFEQRTRRRCAPPVTPPLPSDHIAVRNGGSPLRVGPSIAIEVVEATRAEDASSVRVVGTVSGVGEGEYEMEAYVDGKRVDGPGVDINGKTWSLESSFEPFEPAKPLYGGVGQVVGKVMVVMLARAAGAVAGKLILIDQRARNASSETT